jgi:hypothetical protein
LLCRNFLVSCSPICQSVLLVAEPLEFCLGSHCLCLCVPVYSQLFPELTNYPFEWCIMCIYID